MIVSSHLKHAQKIAKLMDARFSFLGVKFGLDSIIGLVPGLGDLVTFGFSAYLIWIGIRLRLPFYRIVQMFLNAAADTVFGTIPIIGDVADIFFRSNLRNVEILEKYAQTDFEEGEVVQD